MKPPAALSETDPEHEPMNDEGAVLAGAGLALATGFFLAATIWSLAADLWHRARNFKICRKSHPPQPRRLGIAPIAASPKARHE
jgi:hypothetical protein